MLVQILNINVKKSVVQHVEPLSPPVPPKHSPYPLPTVAEQSKSPNGTSILPISAGMSGAVNYMLQDQSPDVPKMPSSQPQPQQSAAPREAENIKPQNITDNVEMKENWRKSDSTNSHTTVRAVGSGGSTRSSRPVSVAESFQSTFTVVQGSSKRLSARLTIDGMPEEDGESFVSVDDNPSSNLSMTPPSSDKVKKRRSLSLNLGSTINSKISLPPPPASASATEHKSSFSRVVPSLPTMQNTDPAQASSLTGLSLAPPPYSSVENSVGHQQPRASGVNNLRGKFAAWANSNLSSDNLSRQDPTLSIMSSQQRRPSLPHFSGDGDVSIPSTPTPPPPTPLRQTSNSMSGNGLGPVKRAVEKMGWRWGMSLSPSSSGSSSGHTSSSSSVNAPSSRTSDYGLVRTNSNRSTPSVHSHIVRSSQSYGSGGGKRTPEGSSGSYSFHSTSSLGPSLGKMLRGGLRNKNGVVTCGMVFGKVLKIVTRETGINVGKEMESESVDAEREGLILELEKRLLPAIVVRCAQHLLIWGLQEEGLFRWVDFFFCLIIISILDH